MEKINTKFCEPEPKLQDEGFDHRIMENAGHYRGVGQPGKIGLYKSNSIDAMPPEKSIKRVPRDHKG